MKSHANPLLKITCIIALGFFLNQLFACATVFSDSTYTIRVESDPPDAEYVLLAPAGAVAISPAGRTPGDLTIDYGSMGTSDPRIQVRKEGYVTETAPVRRTLDYVTLVNILFWPLFLVDVISGSFWKPEQGYYRFQLQREIEPEIIYFNDDAGPVENGSEESP